MTKNEFLEKLKSALGNDLSGPVIQENVNYYNSYINEELGKGRSEEEVLAELGDPWVIARTVINSLEGQDGADYQEGCSYEAPKSGYTGSSYGGRGNDRGRGPVIRPVSRWKVLLLILGIIGIFLVIAAVIGGIISLFAPIILPVLFIMIIVRVLQSRRR